MQSALSRIWTRVAVSISYDVNHYTTELFVIELIIYIKMDLALNNLQKLIFHKSQSTNQITSTTNNNNTHNKKAKKKTDLSHQKTIQTTQRST